MDTCRGAGVCAEPEASTPFRADASLAVLHSPAAAESPGLGKTDFSVPQFQETLNANLCLLKGLFEKMEHIVLRHDSSGAGRWRVGMGERGAHGMLGFEKASCNMNALVAGGGTHWVVGAGQGKGGQRRERAFIYLSNKCLSRARYVSRALPATGNTVMNETDEVPCWRQSPAQSRGPPGCAA